MKTESNRRKLFYQILIIVGIVLLTVALMYSFKTDFPYALASGAIGAILTVVVTMLLLSKQTDTEEIKEKNSKIFEKKLEVYHEFIKALESIIQDGKITLGEKENEKDELAKLLFQLAQVKMHTDDEKVITILQNVAQINLNLDSSKKTVDHIKLAKCLLPIVNTLRKELYFPQKNTKESKSDQDLIKYQDEYNKQLEDIIKGARGSTGEEESEKGLKIEKDKRDYKKEPLNDKEKIEIVKNFETDLIKKLEEILPADLWKYESESTSKLNLSLRNNVWPENTYIGIYDYDNDRMHFAVTYKGIGNYKDIYLILRREFGGRYNQYNWWINAKDPYNKWDDTNYGIEAFKHRDEESLKYFTGQIKDIIETFSSVLFIYEKICKLKSLITFNKKMLNQWIYESYCLVHDYDIDGKKISSDTTLTEEKGWEIQIFGRDEESKKYLQKINTLPKPIDKYPPIEDRYLFATYPKESNIEDVEKSLKELLAGIETYIEKLELEKKNMKI